MHRLLVIKRPHIITNEMMHQRKCKNLLILIPITPPWPGAGLGVNQLPHTGMQVEMIANSIKYEYICTSHRWHDYTRNVALAPDVIVSNVTAQSFDRGSCQPCSWCPTQPIKCPRLISDMQSYSIPLKSQMSQPDWITSFCFYIYLIWGTCSPEAAATLKL